MNCLNKLLLKANLEVETKGEIKIWEIIRVGVKIFLPLMKVLVSLFLLNKKKLW